MNIHKGHYNKCLKDGRARVYISGTRLNTDGAIARAFWLGYHGAPLGFTRGGSCHAAWEAGKTFRGETGEYAGVTTTTGNIIIPDKFGDSIKHTFLSVGVLCCYMVAASVQQWF